MRILDTARVPPGGWRYLEESTGYTIAAASYYGLMNAIEAHRRANNLPLNRGWRQEIDLAICTQLKIEVSHCGEPRFAKPPKSE